MNLIADIASGNTGFADVMFLVGMILAVLAGLTAYPLAVPADGRPRPWGGFSGFLLGFAIAAVALGWLVL